MLGETFGLKRALERLLDDEDDLGAAALQLRANADAIIGRAVGPLGKKDDGRRPGRYASTFTPCQKAT
jgi:hypothetical protein